MKWRRLGLSLVILIYLICLWLALTRATSGGETLLYKAVKGNHWTTVRFLVEIGADVNGDALPQSHPGWTALHYAVAHGSEKGVRRLIELGACADKEDGEGSTPLLLAIIWNKPELLALMLDSGVDVNRKYRSGYTLLHDSAMGGPPEAKRPAMKLLLDHGAIPNSRDRAGATPLHYVVGQGDLSEAALLLNRGADIEAKNARGFTPLAQASESLLSDKVNFFLARGADPNSQDRAGRTPLHLAAASTAWNQVGNSKRPFLQPIPVMEALLAHGADIDAKDRAGKTPLDLAREAGNQRAVDFLRAHGGKA